VTVMTADATRSGPSPKSAVVVRAVTVIIGVVMGLTFLFGFGNVLNLALRLGVPAWVAPLVAPASSSQSRRFDGRNARPGRRSLCWPG
jgi:hypothetical protein